MLNPLMAILLTPMKILLLIFDNKGWLLLGGMISIPLLTIEIKLD